MKYETYSQYLKEIIDLVPDDVDAAFIELLRIALLPIVKMRWEEYLIGKTETYYLTEDELETSWQTANMKLIENNLRNLSEFGLIKMGVNEDGEIVYSITEDGLEYVKNLD